MDINKNAQMRWIKNQHVSYTILKEDIYIFAYVTPCRGCGLNIWKEIYKRKVSKHQEETNIY